MLFKNNVWLEFIFINGQKAKKKKKIIMIKKKPKVNSLILKMSSTGITFSRRVFQVSVC